MTEIQIVCFIGSMIMCFLIGRASKKIKIPILGCLIFYNDNEQPKLMFKCNNFKELKERKYIAIKIENAAESRSLMKG